MRSFGLTLLWTLSLGLGYALELHFIDVGQGDAVLIRSGNGQSVLYDGGRSTNGVLTYLRAVGVESLDLVVASHADADHIGGLIAVIEAYRPRYYMDNGIPHTTATYRRLLEAVTASGSQYLEPTARRIGLGDIALHVLPPPGDFALGQNQNSVGLIIEQGEFRAALTGDASAPQFEWWARVVPQQMAPVSVYKASHHGSLNGDTSLSVNAFHPLAVVISVGGNNSYGHPSQEASLLYHSVKAQVFRTDVHGTVLVEATSDGTFHLSAANDIAPITHLLALATEQAAGDAGRGDVPVAIECVLFDPDGRDDGNEVVTLRAQEAVDVSGWRLKDEAQHTFSLPRVTIAAGATVEVANPGRPAWNNSGDTAFLYDAANNLVDSFSYSGSGSRACR